jgi:hypothetical protein
MIERAGSEIALPFYYLHIVVPVCGQKVVFTAIFLEILGNQKLS